MKKIIFLFCLYAAPAIGATPLTACPSGFRQSLPSSYVELYSGSCPYGMLKVGVAYSCIQYPTMTGCILYAPPGMSFVENGHTYEFDDICPLTN